MAISLRFGKFLVIVSSNKFSVPFSLFSFWDSIIDTISLNGVPLFKQAFWTLFQSNFFFLLWLNNSKRSVFKFTSYFFCLIEPVVKVHNHIFHFLQIKNLVFLISFSFLNFLFCSCIVIKLIELSTCLLLNYLTFLKIIILNSFSDNSQIFVSGKLLCSFGSIMFPWFFISEGFVLMSVYLRTQLPLPAFLDWYGRARLSPEGGCVSSGWVGCSIFVSWKGTEIQSLCSSISWSQCQHRAWGFSVANIAEVLWVAMVAIENIKGKSCCFFSCSPFMPTGGSPSPWDSSCRFIWYAGIQRCSTQLGSWNEAHAKLPQCLGPGAQMHLLWQWHWCLRWENVKIARGKGICVSEAHRSDSTQGEMQCSMGPQWQLYPRWVNSAGGTLGSSIS